jgi:DNA repair protein RecN (Recombination protein N)
VRLVSRKRDTSGAACWLEDLRLEEFVIVPRAELDLAPGLNVLTGETGAGKSILLEAVGLLLGARGSARLVRKGARRARVEGTFRVEGEHPARARLEELGLPLEAGRISVLRELRPDGTGRCWINGTPVRVGQLARLGETLGEIHGPWEHQRLLRGDVQREQLDLFGGLGSLVDASSRRFAAWKEAERALAAHREALERTREQEDWLRFQLQEIEEVGWDEAQREEAERRVEELEASRERIAFLRMVEERLQSGEGSALEIVESLDAEASARRSLPEALRREIAEARRQLRALARRVLEELGRAEAAVEAEEELEALREKLARVRRLEQKYRRPWTQLLERAEEIRAELRRLEEAEERTAELERRLAAARSAYEEAARRLHAGRTRAARKLVEALAPHLADVGWNPHGVRILLREGEPAPWGRDEVVWETETNPGEGWRTLREMVSHGELSRLHLAWLTVLADRQPAMLSIFDEVDTGIGGETALKVGEKLLALARHRQVLLVTHLALLASRAHRHFQVVKRREGGRTVAEVRLLEGEARVEEVARMLAGRRTSARAREHARELLGQQTGRRG